MSSPAESQAFSKAQLYDAYRKAKVDVFFEKTQPLTLTFCRYEDDLDGNLNRLREKLNAATPDWFSDVSFIGTFGFIPKALRPPKQPSDGGPHFGLSDPEDAWHFLLKTLPKDNLAAEFRPVAHFSVDMYIVSALWVNLIGHRYDACLGPSVRGSRVRRLRGDDETGRTVYDYHLTAPGTFQPYFYCYRGWREDGLRAIQEELNKKRKVVAVTMDLHSFYHNVDPEFLVNSDFLTEIHFEETNKGPLLAYERLFTQQLIAAFETWARQLPNYTGDGPAGVPVGPSAPRIIANVILAEFDRLANQCLDPVYYARYVDDVFLVMRDTGIFHKADDVLRHLCSRIHRLRPDDGKLVLDLPYAGKSKLVFESKKQRVFLLSGEVGQDLLDTIRNKIDEVSSEWRLLPNLDDLERSPAARVLTASRQSNEDADSLRKADDLSLRRLGFSLMLRSMDAAARDLPPKEWKKDRERFYRFVTRHVLTPLRLLDLNDYLARLVGLAIACEDYRVAATLIKRIAIVVDGLQKNVVVSPSETADKVWIGYRRHLRMALEEAVNRSLTVPKNSVPPDTRVEKILSALDLIQSDPDGSGDSGTADLLDKLFCRDLARTPFKEAILGDHKIPELPNTFAFDQPNEEQAERAKTIEEFIRENQLRIIDLLPLLFPTRPLRPPEITKISPRCVFDTRLWTRYVHALRGTWVMEHFDNESDKSGSEGVITIGRKPISKIPRIAVTSFLVHESSWARAADGKPDLSRERYNRLVRLANAIVCAPHKPDYVVFPELSIPRRWLSGLAHHFLRARISLIVGPEYQRVVPEPASFVVNEACLFLTDDRLGYSSWCAIQQRKGLPAHQERDELRQKFNLSLAPPDSRADKHVYQHFGFSFGLLICSELTDIRFREMLRGKIDALFILCWNQDLDSFASLVEASCLDIHTFVVLANNRKFGDSRVRGPFKDAWRRDLVRVKGGLDDFFVVTELDINELREFQSNAEPPTTPFKPIPEGFLIAPFRRRIPGGDSHS